MSSPRPPWLHQLVTAVQAPTVLLCDRDGQLRADGAQGVWHADVRVLSRAELRVNGEPPEPVAGGAEGIGRLRFTGYVRSLKGSSSVPSVRVERVRTVRAGLVDETIALTTYEAIPTTTRIEVDLAADLARMGPVREGRTSQTFAPPDVDAGSVRWSDDGARAELVADVTATVTADDDGARLSWMVNLAHPGTRYMRWRLYAAVDDSSFEGVEGDPGWATPRVVAGDHRLPMLVDRSLADLGGLRLRRTSGSDIFLAAGAPDDCVLRGRESLWAARMLLPLGTELAAGTLRALSAWQGRRLDPDTGEAPGKVPHEVRDPVPGDHRARPVLSYASTDATPLWVCLLHDAWRWGLPAEQVRDLMPQLEAALTWMVEHGDADGDGFVESFDRSRQGIGSEGWKDSPDAMRFADGEQAKPPLVLCEVQGYAYEAAMHGADLLDAFDRPNAQGWRLWASGLADRFRKRFWVPSGLGPYPAMALDADKRPVDALTSNIGHLLGTGLLNSGESERVVRLVTQPALVSGYGLRTMSVDNAAYTPVNPYCGAIWPHDTAIVIRGLAAVGRGHRAAELIEGLLAASMRFDFQLPPSYGGDPRSEVARPIPYPVMGRPRAWSAASAMAILQALLGLEADVPAGRLRMRPVRPSLVGRLRVEGLRVGGHAFDVSLSEDGRSLAPVELPLNVDIG
ncbi:MAG TPA: glycogen debranching N-terminal domain-containing protein [Nocardioidaceae bacterium]|nr:glycogen debranching N-terminal domain-containing protein [Nocardioidaceae bacterium]